MNTVFKWRYEFHNDKTVLSLLEKQNKSTVNVSNGVIGCFVTVTKLNIEERYEYRNLGVVKMTQAHALLTLMKTLTKPE